MKSHLFCMSILFVLSGLLMACSGAASSGAVPYTTFSQGEIYTPPSESAQPGLLVIEDASRVQEAVAGIVDAAAVARLEQSIKEGKVAVIVYAPQQSSSGYSITIQEIASQAGAVTVVAETEAPSKDVMSNQVLSYPYQIVLVDESQVPAGATWVLETAQVEPVAKDPSVIEQPAETPEERQPESTQAPVGTERSAILAGAESLARGEAYQWANPMDMPGVLAAEKYADIEKSLPDSLSPEIVESLKNASAEGKWILVVYRGMLSTSGYGIEVVSLQLAAGQGQVTVKLTGPAGQMANQVISYPYEILLLDSTQYPFNRSTIWTLLDQSGKELTHPMP